MSTLREFPGWFSKQKLSGKLAISCTGLFVICCIFGASASMLSPSAPAPNAPDSTPMEVESIYTAAAETVFVGMTQTAIANAPTHTFTPPAEPTHTATSIPTSTPDQLTTLSSQGASCVPSTTKRDEGIVVGIVDGDTIDVVINGQNFRVRYIGIDTPERGNNFYEQATAQNRALVYNKRVWLVKDVSETDRYDRILRYIIVDNIFVNYELVRQGYALSYTYPPDVACSDIFVSAQNQAQSTQAGFWASAPVLPTAVSGNNNNSGGNGGNCDPSYPTVCIAPSPPDLDCKDVPYRRFQVLPPDPHRFDGDDDGIGCES